MTKFPRMRSFGILAKLDPASTKSISIIRELYGVSPENIPWTHLPVWMQMPFKFHWRYGQILQEVASTKSIFRISI
jgi:hypothetical protein